MAATCRWPMLDPEASATGAEVFELAWREWEVEMAFHGFDTEDFDELFNCLVPSLDGRLLRPAPDVARGRSVERQPKGRLYLDVDGAFSPICPQPQDHGLLDPTRRVRLHAGGPPETGWRWEMCAHGLGPTPVPVELAQGLVALDRTEIEVVWLTSWQAFADELLPVVDIDAAFRDGPRDARGRLEMGGRAGRDDAGPSAVRLGRRPGDRSFDVAVAPDTDCAESSGAHERVPRTDAGHVDRRARLAGVRMRLRPVDGSGRQRGRLIDPHGQSWWHRSGGEASRSQSMYSARRAVYRSSSTAKSAR